MVFTQSHGFVVGASFGLPHLSRRCRFLVCNAADTASLATRFLFGKLLGVATLVGFGEKRCRKNLPLGGAVYEQWRPQHLVVALVVHERWRCRRCRRCHR